MKHLALKTFGWLVAAAAALAPSGSASAQQYDGRNMRFLYAFNVIGSTDPAIRTQMAQLQQAGINAIPLRGDTPQAMADEIARLRSDPLLSRFKVVLALNGIAHDAWFADQATACTPGQERLQTWLGPILDSIAQIGKDNPDLVVGYYTFDEPALYGVCKRYQELIYQRLRQADPDASARPVMMANTPQGLTDAQIQYSMSNDAQDVVMIDQYPTDENTQVDLFQRWKRNGLLADPVVYILPAFDRDRCLDPKLRTDFQPMLQRALQRVFGDDKPQTYGEGYFAYWPGAKPDFAYGADNCTPILDSVVDHLRVRPDLEVVRIQTQPLEFRPGDAVRFAVTIRNAGAIATARDWHGVLIQNNGRCFDSGCSWGGFYGSLQPGQEAVVDISQNAQWTASAGLHALTAIVDDQFVIQEGREDNNQSTREILVGDKPDLVAGHVLTWPSSFQPGTNVSFSTILSNRGSVSTGPQWLGVLYTVDGACPATGCAWGGQQGALAPGESIWVNPNDSNWPATPGPHTIEAIADDQQLIAELDESNNRSARTIQVGALPDLRIRAVSVEPAQPRVGDSVRFIATVENVGSMPLDAPWVGLLSLRDGACLTPQCVWGGQTNAQLPPGMSMSVATYSENWNPSAPGRYALRLVIDDSNAVAESREDNNTFDFEVEVR